MGSNSYKFAFDLVEFQRSLFIYDIYEPQVTKKTVFSLVFAKSRCVMIPKNISVEHGRRKVHKHILVILADHPGPNG